MKRLLVSLWLVLSPLSLAAESIFPGYEWQSIANGIYLHSRTDPFAGPVDGNSVVIINDKDVVVVDTHINPAAARAVVAKIKSLTANPVSHVVNTHWHDDHVNGNHTFLMAFPDAAIVAHPYTAAKLESEWLAFEDDRRLAYEAVTAEQVFDAANAVEKDDPERARSIRVYGGYVEALKDELATLELAYPTVHVDQSLELKRGERLIRILWPGDGNTKGDLVVSIPSEGIVITGDTVVAPIPYAFDSPVIQWIDALNVIQAMNPRILIPGHGAVQHDLSYVKQLSLLLTTLVQEVEQAAKDGAAFEDLEVSVDLSALKEQFVKGDVNAADAWQSFFLEPGRKSAWTALGYPIPNET